MSQELVELSDSEERLNNFKCFECEAIIQYQLSWYGIKTDDNLCMNCYKQRLKITDCIDDRYQKLCDEDCLMCYNRSLVSSDKFLFIDLDQVEELGLPLPRNITQGSRKKYPFIGECGHPFVMALKYLKQNGWCPVTECVVKRRNATNVILYGVDNVSKLDSIKKKKEETCMKNHGTKNPNQNQKIKDKIAATNLKRYGHKCSGQGKEIKKKAEATNLKRYGHKCSFMNKKIQDKIKRTMMERWGCENPNQNKSIREKIRKTNRLKYGCDYPSQNFNILYKQMMSAFTYKEYILPSGKKIYVQGYEVWALDLLLEEYLEEDIQTSIDHRIIVDYISPDGKNHKYFPDIYIKSKNLIIEVKSTWTYKQHLEINNIKAQACIDNNYNFQFYKFTDKKKLTILEAPFISDENIKNLPNKISKKNNKTGLASKTVKELIKLCKERGIANYSRKKKDEIITLIESFD